MFSAVKPCEVRWLADFPSEPNVQRLDRLGSWTLGTSWHTDFIRRRRPGLLLLVSAAEVLPHHLPVPYKGGEKRGDLVSERRVGDLKPCACNVLQPQSSWLNGFGWKQQDTANLNMRRRTVSESQQRSPRHLRHEKQTKYTPHPLSRWSEGTVSEELLGVPPLHRLVDVDNRFFA